MPGDRRLKTAIVMFNLGGPDRPEAIGPYLLNLFLDPAILRIAAPLRMPLAWLLSRTRLQPARENYAALKGRSPLLDLTRAQASAVADKMSEAEFACFIAMRYWEPSSEATAQAVRAWGAEQVVLLPLYPQFSSTTSGSSFSAWHEAAAKVGLDARTYAVCCYPTQAEYLESVVELLRMTYAEARAALPPGTPLRVLFSAHGLPESIIKQGDPYQWQVEQSVMGALAQWAEPDVDWAICYQSRATPQRWIGPSTISEIERAARDRVGLLVVPIVFVSEHSETLVELDIEYRRLAERLGVPGYFRVPTPGIKPAYIEALTHIVSDALAREPGLRSFSGNRLCPMPFGDCPFRPAPSSH